MNDIEVFEPFDASFSNLGKISVSQGEAFEMHICELALIADCLSKKASGLLDEGINIYEVFAMISESVSFDAPGFAEDTLPENRDAIGYFMSNVSLLDKAMLSKLLIDKLRDSGRAVSESDFLESLHPQETFTYVKNALADEAYDVFSQDFSDPRLSYAQSFKDACRMVAEGDVGYCILPFEERGGIRIPGIASIIASFDLKIVSVTPVFGFEGNADVKYALFSRTFKISEHKPEDDRYLEILTSFDESLTVAKLLCVAELFGISVYRINTIDTVIDGEETTSFSIVLRDDGNDFTPFLAFLALFAEEYTPVGFYTNLE